MKKIIRRPAVEQKTGRSRAWIYAEMPKGTFPRPVQIGSRAVGWIESEIDAWIEQRVAERDGATAA